MTTKVEGQYQLYLQRVALKENQMHPEQRRQLRQAFFGAWGQALIHLRDEVGALPEEQGIEVLEAQLQEVGNYFIEQTNRKN